MLKNLYDEKNRLIKTTLDGITLLLNEYDEKDRLILHQEKKNYYLF